ncbi:hypothetical protein FHW23_001162 [Curtobacterium pusillum]|uniref:DUF262 domain-containing protein n=1 Tax=Curtobacterium pusillum TaxID=69373 RepID=A0AAW3T3W1_9MICO|nr:hypothetical protein [Curtobacterium pusillum]
MKAEEVTAEKLFDGGQQLLIPLWQRRYSWTKNDWEDLWRDLLRVHNGEASSHFIGSVVLHQLRWGGMPSEAKRYSVVDGQQRITTLTILVCAIRDRIARLAPDMEARASIQADYTSQLLSNSNLKEGHQERLILQEYDRGALSALVSGTMPSDGQSSIADAYSFFTDQLVTFTQDQAVRLLSNILIDLDAVWVMLDAKDNAHRVFQTLNAGGKPLRQVDLIRNYFFLLLGEKGDEFYESQWKILETDLSARELDEFFVAWTVSQGFSGARGSLFSYFQRELSVVEENPPAVAAYGRELIEASRYFQWIRRPEDCPYKAVRRSLTDLSNWGTLPFEGLILLLLRKLASAEMSEGDVADGLEIILGFVARRMLAGYEPNVHKSIAVGVAAKIAGQRKQAGSDTVDYIRFKLSTGTDVQSWPNDQHVLERVGSLPMYAPSRRAWTFLILERINRKLFEYEKHAPAALDRSAYSIEHIMPQHLTGAWEADLIKWGVSSPSALHSSRVHALGNLTLSPINSELSDRSFEEKISMLADDSLRLNQELGSGSTWTGVRIDERSHSLASRALEAFVGPLSESEIAAQHFDELLSEAPEQVDDDLEEDNDLA